MTKEAVSRKLFVALGLAVVALLSATAMSATNISVNTTTDNAFYLYISTNNNTLGTLVASANDWTTVVSFSAALTPGVTNYLQVESINYGGPAGLLGDFTLSNTGFKFANGTQYLLTNTTDWVGSYNNGNSDPNAPQPWVTPTGAVFGQGANDGTGQSWGPLAGIDPNAVWIWPSDSDSVNNVCQLCTVDFSIPIYVGNSSPTPEPGTLLTFGTSGLGLLGWLGRRYSR